MTRTKLVTINTLISEDQQQILHKIQTEEISMALHIRRALDMYMSRPDIMELAAQQKDV